jgi:hypothetical protein
MEFVQNSMHSAQPQGQFAAINSGTIDATGIWGTPCIGFYLTDRISRRTLPVGESEKISGISLTGTAGRPKIELYEYTKRGRAKTPKRQRKLVGEC